MMSRRVLPLNGHVFLTTNIKQMDEKPPSDGVSQRQAVKTKI